GPPRPVADGRYPARGRPLRRPRLRRLHRELPRDGPGPGDRSEPVPCGGIPGRDRGPGRHHDGPAAHAGRRGARRERAGARPRSARRALSRMVDTLLEGDRFAVHAFDDSIESSPGTGLVPATDRNRFRAVEFLAAIEARGGTMMAPPLMQAVAELAASGPGRDRDRPAAPCRGWSIPCSRATASPSTPSTTPSRAPPGRAWSRRPIGTGSVRWNSWPRSRPGAAP